MSSALHGSLSLNFLSQTFKCATTVKVPPEDASSPKIGKFISSTLGNSYSFPNSQGPPSFNYNTFFVYLWLSFSLSLFPSAFILAQSFHPFFFFFFFCCSLWCLVGILVPWPGIEPATSAVRAWSPNHWTSREFPSLSILKQRKNALHLTSPPLLLPSQLSSGKGTVCSWPPSPPLPCVWFLLQSLHWNPFGQSCQWPPWPPCTKIHWARLSF